MTDRPRRKSDAARRANQVIRGRTMLIMLLLGVASFTVLFWKLYDLQINRHDELKAEAVSQQTDSMVISASRGTIYDKNGEIMAENDMKNGKLPDVDYVCGIPDSGVPHAIGYANRSGIPFARPFIKYTPTWPRSFMPANQSMRNRVAKMKLIPVPELIRGKKLLFVDDSIVRGTQMRETVEFLYENGAKEVHMRSACPPIMYGCKYLNFSRSTSEMELIARQIIDENEGVAGLQHIDEYSNSNTERGKLLRDEICRRLQLTSLEFQSLEGTIRAVGKPDCQLCSYCWNGRE